MLAHLWHRLNYLEINKNQEHHRWFEIAWVFIIKFELTICCNIKYSTQIWLLDGSRWCTFIQRRFEASPVNLPMKEPYPPNISILLLFFLTSKWKSKNWSTYLGQTTRIFSLSAMHTKSKSSSKVRPCGTCKDRNSGGCGITRRIRPAELNFKIRWLQ